MLQGIRDRAQSWIMWVIVILLIIPFALWGVHQYFGPEANVVVAEVNGKELHLRELQENYQRQRQRLRQVLGDEMDLDRLDEGRLKRETLNRMIEEELLVQAGLDEGMRVGDEQLAAAIRTLEVFQEDGRFSEERYQLALRNMGYSPGSFEHVLRRDMLRAQLERGLVDGAFVTDAGFDVAVQVAAQERSFHEAVIPAERFKDAVDVGAADIQRYYDDNPEAFTVPERVVVAWIELSRERLAEEIQLSESELRRAYESRQQNFLVPEERRARHILLGLEPEAEPAEVAAVRERAEDLAARLRAGADFAALAREHSDDPGSAEAGGDLGFFQRGAMVPAFEEAAFDLEPGEVSDPVRSPFGFHIIEVTDTRGGGVRPFDEVAPELRRQLRLERAEQRFFEQAERFANLVFEHPDTLEVAAAELELEIREAGPFSREGAESGIAANDRFVAAAFSEEVADGLNSEPLELGQNRLVALRLRERIPAELQPLDAVRAEIRARLVEQRARERAAELGEALIERLRAGAERAALAAEHDLTWESRQSVQRGAPDADPRLLDAVFRMPRPEGLPRFDGVTLGNGDYAVIALDSVRDGSPGALSPDQREAFRSALADGFGEETYAALVAALRAGADVKIFESRL